MCQKLVVLATMLPMLIHSIFGCCWHHAHSACGSPEPVAAAAADADSQRDRHCCHGHFATPTAKASTDDQDSGRPGDRSPCQDQSPCDVVRCDYIATEPVKGITPLGIVEQVEMIESLDGLIQLLSTIAVVDVHRDPRTTVSAAARHRALTQVWVV